MVSNLRGNFFNFFCLIDSAKDFKKNSCCLIGFAKLSSVRKYEHNVSIHTKHDKKMGGHCEIIFWKNDNNYALTCLPALPGQVL